MRIVDQRPIATLALNGTELPMRVDSGALFSMSRASAAAPLNQPLRRLPTGFRIDGYTGRVEAQQTTVERLGLLGAELRDIDFIVGGNALGAGIVGMPGRNFLSATDTEYELAHGELRLIAPKGDCDQTNLACWAGEAPVIAVPLDAEARGRADKAIRVEVVVNGA